MGTVPEFAYGLPGGKNILGEFDPAGFLEGKDKLEVYRLREAELAHGRVSMLALSASLSKRSSTRFSLEMEDPPSTRSPRCLSGFGVSCWRALAMPSRSGLQRAGPSSTPRRTRPPRLCGRDITLEI